MEMATSSARGARHSICIDVSSACTSQARWHFVHVDVERETRHPVSLSEAMRTALAPLAVDAEAQGRQLLN
jgi:acyl-CoA thioesterase FadM